MTSNNAPAAPVCLTDCINEPPLPDILTDAQASNWQLRVGYFFKENGYFSLLLMPAGLWVAAMLVAHLSFDVAPTLQATLQALQQPFGNNASMDLYVVLMGMAITMFIAIIVGQSWDHESLLAPLNEDQLFEMVEIAEADPAVRAWAQQALTDGKTLRLRDYKAASYHRAWHISIQRRLSRLDALRKLADPIEPESQTLTASGAYPTQDERIDGPRTEA
uniref:Uncharacterized protein n=1 Tax=Caenorhabditis japonica TaxID=281687 RepID=A0A8R1IRC5_CAEJA